jgi:selenide,water dikinase
VTTDFFPPIVDDPRWFGRIAAANALSDVFAMGGEALVALNLVCWPAELDLELLGEVLAGGLEKIREAGAALAGGHSVRDNEVKYGLAVTGMVHPDRFWRNSGAREGDLVILTKPLGMGTVSTAIKRGAVTGDGELVQRAMAQMAELNRAAALAVRGLAVHGATDVTGFGLVGHGQEMADGAGLTLELRAAELPIFGGALELARAGVVSGGGRKARGARAAHVRIADGVDEALAAMVFDAETSGGLLLALSERETEVALRRLRDAGVAAARVVGRFAARRAATAVELIA